MYLSTAVEGSTLEDEDYQYLSEPIEPNTTNISKSWKSHTTTLPILEVMAHKYLAIAAMSAPSERIFSRKRKILSYQWESLSVMHLEQLSHVKSWLQTFGSLYSNDN
ncbi:hypothetical protein O181_000471 [Austropuccinia psidii MF-1]|uniref:HAT C-terminal dimerisation domain-containing protein n=1 Tax=Austropuccinia psidii MF-1 TaxID=1389203 RepID=A0A9Q3B8L7_9BASI|nr:hypothetical protein [Austropuccinia psidii MF-1]